MIEEESNLFRSLWKESKLDRHIDGEVNEVLSESSNEPKKIFGTFKNQKKRGFVKECILLGIRPLEEWSGRIERLVDDKLTWFELRKNKPLGILFECPDGSRIIGMIYEHAYKRLPKLEIGERYKVQGVFEFLELVSELDVCLFFSLKSLSK
ncbi:hypothetical protein [Candidatus Mycoplasma haematohominis]|uniref:hypothetical protein n=1 Tax=Candidatus Mycoplasma haematohominis TaxID=1494318 RepID=UPI001C0A7609|nr:hypothetical protein [Candidatus Mycoplasma haemohominis]